MTLISHKRRNPIPINGIYYICLHSMTISNQILHGDQTRKERNIFFTVDHVSDQAKKICDTNPAPSVCAS